jgi:glycerophosphoryl diester phosphodiesterase
MRQLAIWMGCLAAAWFPLCAQQPAAALTGFARLAPDTFAEGPPSGAFLPDGTRREPRFPSQPVQGFSSIVPIGADGWWLALADNGFGSRLNSPDFLLRVYRVRPRWRTAEQSRDGGVEVDARIIALSDPDRRVPFRIVREFTSDRLLTGADFDPESLVVHSDGTLWVGEEFGPFLLHFSADGWLLDPPFELPGLRSPDHPLLPPPEPAQRREASAGRSRGIEGLASCGGAELYALPEAPSIHDEPLTTRIIEFDTRRGAATGRVWIVPLDPAGGAVTELRCYGPGRLLTIERDNAQGAAARFKRVFALEAAAPGSRAIKRLVLDLLSIGDPTNLGGLGPTFRFPFITPESVHVEDPRTLVLVNDNNFPASGGRGDDRDATEFIRVRLAAPLP